MVLVVLVLVLVVLVVVLVMVLLVMLVGFCCCYFSVLKSSKYNEKHLSASKLIYVPSLDIDVGLPPL